MLLQGFSQPNFKSILADQVWSQAEASQQESEEGTLFNKDAPGSLLPSSCFDCKILISTKKKFQKANCPQNPWGSDEFWSITPPYS